ncbi:hypothetical protein MTO96_021942 [Rhipicephalus appendiculatus]
MPCAWYEAHLCNQRIRLSHTEHGRAVLRKIGWQIEPVPIKAALPEDWKTTIQTKPFPRNMTPGKDDDRRTARAKAMARKLEENSPGSCTRTPRSENTVTVRRWWLRPKTG